MHTPPPPPPAKRMGLVMIVTAWVLLLGLLTLLFGRWEADQRNPNAEVAGAVLGDGTREVVLERNRAGHYVAGGRINGEPVVFVLDTGATQVSVPAGVARRIGLAPGPAVPVQTANGTVTVYATRLDRVELGSIARHDVRAHINPHMEGEEILLGMSFLKPLEFTQRGDTLTLRQHGAEG